MERRSISEFLDKQKAVEWVRDLFNLSEDKARDEEIIQSVRKNVEFRGVKLWILIFAIFIASIGLNVNSTAVIIGAMLISPLMGPIMGVGLGAGINDFPLIRKAVLHLGIATVIGIAASAIYFWVSPLQQAQSEILMRTSPNFWDVLVAFFGGLAGIMAATRSEKSNVIPGVAIATALMPPLCTAGYGLATKEWDFFLGAFYLYCINAVFIALSTFIVVKFLSLPEVEFVDQRKGRLVKRVVTFVAIGTFLPSTYLAYTFVQNTLFKQEVDAFIDTEFKLSGSQVARHQLVKDEDGKMTIDVVLAGNPIERSVVNLIQAKMSDYDLPNTNLHVSPIKEEEDQSEHLNLLADLYKNNEVALKDKDSHIKLLEDKIREMTDEKLPMKEMSSEIRVFFPSIKEFSVNRNVIYGQHRVDTMLMAFIRSDSLSLEEQDKVKAWLEKRCHEDKVVTHWTFQ